MFILDFILEGTVAEYFEREILFDKEKVLFLGILRTRGTFYWPRFKDILVYTAVFAFIIIEIAVYFACKYSKNKERKNTIEYLSKRIEVLSKGEVPEEVQELMLIDSKIKDILREKELIKQEISLEMNKKNDLVTYLAHDLKTPLTSIIGYLTILDESDVSKDMQRDFIKKLLEKSYRLEELTNQFFDISRFNLHEIPLNKALLDGEFFLNQMTEELYPLVNKKNLSFYIDIPKPFKIYADGMLMARVLNNLLKNAIIYSREGTAIKISGKNEEKNIVLIIENDGDVISEQELKLIFEKFYRRDRSRGQSAGSGLGLAIAKEIVLRHKGEINAESEAGHTTFTITLPNSL